MTITLYDMQDSPHARKVRLLAAELGVALDCVSCDPRTGETRSPGYLALNPNGKVPTLKEDGFVLWESPAILKYLAAKQPERGLAGTGSINGCSGGAADRRPRSTRSPGKCSSSRGS